jgi:hypothetical protein
MKVNFMQLMGNQGQLGQVCESAIRCSWLSDECKIFDSRQCVCFGRECLALAIRLLHVVSVRRAWNCPFRAIAFFLILESIKQTQCW